MAPLILHNVPDEELYVGEDGIQRPYAMVFPQYACPFAFLSTEQPATNSSPRTDSKTPSTTRNRRQVPDTGAFGRPTRRRSRSVKSATPARREDPTISNAAPIFTRYFETLAQPEEAPDALSQQQQQQQRRTSQHSSPLLATPSDDNSSPPDASTAATARNIPNVPTEIILRGFKNVDQQYAAINRYEHIAGRICEDYPRDPPYEIRRYKSDLRDPALVRRGGPNNSSRPLLTPDERARVNRAHSGDHWVKITFESQQAADAACFASPQAILGHLVYAELYRGTAPVRDEPVPDATTLAQGDEIPAGWRRAGFGGNRTAAELRQPFSDGRLPEELVAGDAMDMSPPHSHASSRTVESGTVGTVTSSSSTTVTGLTTTTNGGALAATTTAVNDANKSAYCRVIPTARKAVLLPAEQALLPQQSFTSRVLSQIPFLKWFSGSMIGNQVPRTPEGEFDWVNASLYWKIICWLDLWFRLFSGDIYLPDKEE